MLLVAHALLLPQRAMLDAPEGYARCLGGTQGQERSACGPFNQPVAQFSWKTWVIYKSCAIVIL